SQRQGPGRKKDGGGGKATATGGAGLQSLPPLLQLETMRLLSIPTVLPPAAHSARSGWHGEKGGGGLGFGEVGAVLAGPGRCWETPLGAVLGLFLETSAPAPVRSAARALGVLAMQSLGVV
ncbi:unnamed protein product, partial [Discosporangium mesarthrocarpum]